MGDMHELVARVSKNPRGPVRDEPEPAPIEIGFVSVDDHLVEPPDTFVGRLPKRFADRQPKVVRGDDGLEYWDYDGELHALTGGDAYVTWRPTTAQYLGPVTYDEIRPATFDVHARVRDMDLDGTLAAVNYPSGLVGFCGRRFFEMRDHELGLACLRAYNDWILEGWTGAYPDRMIPAQMAWLPDPEVAAADVRANAARGFKAVSFSENPEKLGFPSIYSDVWDPFFAACVETQTVVNLHVGSSSETMVPSRDSPLPVLSALFPVNALATTVDWLFSGIPHRYPDIKIVMAEGGIGWVPMLQDRLTYFSRHDADGFRPAGWPSDLTPRELLHRNFWFTTFFDPVAFEHRHEIGVDRIMVESDYPHPDTSWPDTQRVLGTQFAQFSQEDVEQMTYRNALELYRHPMPDVPWWSPAPSLVPR
jgi:predicted TIM-barrel fold metal-dependent hydrolase